jgi:hypothetical protein
MQGDATVTIPLRRRPTLFVTNAAAVHTSPTNLMQECRCLSRDLIVRIRLCSLQFCVNWIEHSSEDRSKENANLEFAKRELDTPKRFLIDPHIEHGKAVFALTKSKAAHSKLLRTIYSFRVKLKGFNLYFS